VRGDFKPGAGRQAPLRGSGLVNHAMACKLVRARTHLAGLDHEASPEDWLSRVDVLMMRGASSSEELSCISPLRWCQSRRACCSKKLCAGKGMSCSCACAPLASWPCCLACPGNVIAREVRVPHHQVDSVPEPEYEPLYIWTRSAPVLSDGRGRDGGVWMGST